jgi:hypothetical protein
LVVACALALLGADQKAKTENGREVILHDDGTWEYANAPKAPTKTGGAGEFKKPAEAVLQYKGKRGTFALYLLPSVWRRVDNPTNPSAEVQFTRKDGDAFAMVIAERIAVPLDTLKAAALENMKKADKGAKILKEEKRVVNGKEVLCLTMNAQPVGVPITFYSYYYSGNEGSIQVVTWTGQSLFQEMKPEMENFLNGFSILEK